MRMTKISTAIAVLVTAIASSARSEDLAAIRQALETTYALTTPTADKTDIARAGSVLVLKKSNLLTVDVTKMAFFPNTYKNGRITYSKLALLMKDGKRTFVSGEKLWVTGIDVKDNAVVFNLFTDAFSDVHYRGTLKFPLDRGSAPTAGVVTAMVAEVFEVEQSDAPATATAARPANPPASPESVAPPPPIPPPPPPPADPKTIALGQTVDQVVSNFGQPDKVIKLGARQSYVYKDMKVSFVGGKVTDVQ